MKELKEGAYTVDESERAAGLGTDNKQRGVEDVIKRFDGINSSAAGPSIVAQPQA